MFPVGKKAGGRCKETRIRISRPATSRGLGEKLRDSYALLGKSARIGLPQLGVKRICS